MFDLHLFEAINECRHKKGWSVLVFTATKLGASEEFGRLYRKLEIALGEEAMDALKIDFNENSFLFPNGATIRIESCEARQAQLEKEREIWKKVRIFDDIEENLPF